MTTKKNVLPVIENLDYKKTIERENVMGEEILMGLNEQITKGIFSISNIMVFRGDFEIIIVGINYLTSLIPDCIYLINYYTNY